MLAFLSAIALLPLLFASPVAVQKRGAASLIRSGRDGLCLTIDTNNPNVITNGLAVISGPCVNGTIWSIERGSGSILVAGGISFALDAGSYPGNNGALKIWNSYPGLYQQTWYWTDDNRIAITGGDQCLDEGDNGIQTYQCTTGNTNQIFYVDDAPNLVTRTIDGVTSYIVGPSGTVTQVAVDPATVTQRK